MPDPNEKAERDLEFAVKRRIDQAGKLWIAYFKEPPRREETVQFATLLAFEEVASKLRRMLP